MMSRPVGYEVPSGRIWGSIRSDMGFHPVGYGVPSGRIWGSVRSDMGFRPVGRDIISYRMKSHPVGHECPVCDELTSRGWNRARIEAADPAPHGQHDFEDMWTA
eukprot:gene26256-biopygen15352